MPVFEQYKKELEEFSVIGVSAHSLEEAQYAQEYGATYVTFSHIFPTKCKEGLEPRGLKELEEVFGSDRKLTVCRELTKKHETAFQTTFSEAIAHYEATEPRGECVLVIEGKSREQIRQEEVNKWEEMSLEEHMDFYTKQGIDRKEAMKRVAKDRGMAKRDVYKALLD